VCHGVVAACAAGFISQHRNATTLHSTIGHGGNSPATACLGTKCYVVVAAALYKSAQLYDHTAQQPLDATRISHRQRASVGTKVCVVFCGCTAISNTAVTTCATMLVGRGLHIGIISTKCALLLQLHCWLNRQHRCTTDAHIDAARDSRYSMRLNANYCCVLRLLLL
jgi:hypothetical protein